MFTIFLFSCSSQDSTPSTGFISLHPSITETFYALGAEHLLKGRSDYCERPKAAQALPKFGTSLTPNFEMLASQNIAHIVGDNAITQHQEALSQLGTVHSLPWLSVDDMKTSITTIGDMTDTADEATTLANTVSDGLKPQPGKESVLLLLSGSVISKGQLWYIKPESIHGAVLEASGYRNAIPKGKNIPQMGIEELLSLDPAVVAIIGDSNTPLSEFDTKTEELKELTSLQAVQSNKICTLSIENAYGTGPSVVKQVQVIQEQLNQCLQ